ncbi:MAG TPA: M28 family peptidase [Vicinamibacterales bacterium]|nr:M28 family peptidase [Vicinamibacterales bacterium]
MPVNRHLSLAGMCLLAVACLSADAPATPQADPAPVFDAARAWKHLEALVAIGPRPAGSPGAERTRAYIREQLAALGLKTADQAFDADTPAGRIRMVNLTATIPAAGSASGRLLFASHYDTKRFDDITFVGANDGGSSTAFLVELARVLKARRNALTIELVFFDGEEAIGDWSSGNTWGSRHYVDAARKAGTLGDLKAMILVDMIGDRNLTIKRDTNSTPWLLDIIWSAARRLNRPEFVSDTTTIDDDHLPFVRAGVPAVDIIDLDYPDETMAYWHTAEDTLDKLSPKSLQVVADVLLAALPGIEARVK